VNKTKKQTGGLSELVKSLDNFVDVFEANTMPTQDGGRKIAPLGFDRLNDKAKILMQSLNMAYEASIPQGKVIYENKKDGTTLSQAAFDENQRDIIFQIIRALHSFVPAKRTGLLPGIDNTNPLKPEKIFSAEDVARLNGAAMILREIADIEAGAGTGKRPKGELEKQVDALQKMCTQKIAGVI